MDPTARGPGAARPVRRRDVLDVPGYDPRSPRTDFLLFSRELRKFAALDGITATLKRESEPVLPGRPAARFLAVKGAGRRAQADRPEEFTALVEGFHPA